MQVQSKPSRIRRNMQSNSQHSFFRTLCRLRLSNHLSSPGQYVAGQASDPIPHTIPLLGVTYQDRDILRILSVHGLSMAGFALDQVNQKNPFSVSSRTGEDIIRRSQSHWMTQKGRGAYLRKQPYDKDPIFEERGHRIPTPRTPMKAPTFRDLMTTGRVLR